ncbi:MAG: hypothetical protein ACYS6I_06490 [Planctomycetota bacterium]|jgi:hypothetical protein
MKQLTFLFTVISLSVLSMPNTTYAQNNLKVWNEFVAALQQNQITPDKVKPYPEMISFKETLMGFIQILREKVSPEQWQASPEVHQVKNHFHYIISLTIDGQTATYCFTFLVEANDWYFRHLEAITIRLDKIGDLPTSEFPDISEETKAWQRQEIHWTKQVNLFNRLTKKMDRKFAYDWFKDGVGYFLAAKTWVPYYPSEKAFILYLCWEQANLAGNKPPRDNYVILEKLNDKEALIRMKLMYFDLYKVTSHLRHQISFEDYKKIFETIWLDRATAAGWNLTISYQNDECLFQFAKE